MTRDVISIDLASQNILQALILQAITPCAKKEVWPRETTIYAGTENITHIILSVTTSLRELGSG